MRLLVTLAICAAGWSAMAQTDEAPAPEATPVPEATAAMTLDGLWDVVQALDPEAMRQGTRMQLTVSAVPVLVIADPFADRMRAMVPIRSTEGMSADEYRRVLEANFDTALDARYAIARERLWGVFIHPLKSLQRDQLISGLGQAVNVALSYGDSYSSGAVTFMEGDTADRQRALLKELLRRGEEL